MSYRYVTMFDNLGFECIIDITCDDASRAEAVLHDEPDPQDAASSLINKLMLRARVNPQRNPEIWVFWSDMSEDVLFDAAQESPQQMADLIRSKGVSILNASKQKQVIV